MPSDYVKDLVDHKQRVAKYMRKVADHLLYRLVGPGDVLPYTNEYPVHLMHLIDVTCKFKRDMYGAQIHPSEQFSQIIENTLTYLSHCDEITTSHWIAYVVGDLFQRAAIHDHSKFSPEEYEAYEQAFPALQKYAYGTPEFKAELAKIQPAIQHHYSVNDHHPEFFKNGVNGMHLVQLIEMTCDWMAASERSQTNMYAGLKINKKRFGLDDQLYEVIKNTMDVLDEQPLIA